MKRKSIRKLRLDKETVAHLEAASLAVVNGGTCVSVVVCCDTGDCNGESAWRPCFQE